MALYSYIDACYNRLMAGSASSPLPTVPDFPRQVVKAISNRLGLLFIAEKAAGGNLCLANAEEVRPEYRTTFSPGDLLDYYYGLLHTPPYRPHYQEFLKKDFSSLPYPKDIELFWLLAQLGRRLRQLPLLERPEKEHHLPPFPISGSNRVLVHRFVVEEREGLGGEEELSATGRIFINDHQYFSNVAASVWGFGLGVHLPAQRWLEDRIGHKLGLEDVLHYQRILAVLAATDRLVREFNG